MRVAVALRSAHVSLMGVWTRREWVEKSLCHVEEHRKLATPSLSAKNVCEHRVVAKIIDSGFGK